MCARNVCKARPLLNRLELMFVLQCCSVDDDGCTISALPVILYAAHTTVYDVRRETGDGDRRSPPSME